jgi:AraC-like DNA-binding protein
MAGALKRNPRRGLSPPAQEQTRDRKERSGPVLEHSYRSSKIDEIEHVVSTQITPHKLVPLSRDRSVDSAFHFHGAKNLAVFDIRYGSRIAVEFEHYEAGDLLGFVMANEGTGRVRLDREEFGISQSEGVMITSGPRETLQYAEDCETRVLLMNRSRIAEYCAKLLGREIGKSVDFQAHFSLETTSGQSWLRLTQYVASELQEPHSMLKFLPAAQQQIEQTLITSLLLAHRHTYSDALLKPQSPAAPFYVKRAEAFIEAHFSEPLSLADIAAQAGVSARSLQNGFQNFRTTTPMGFLRSLRLKHAHEMLLLSDPSTVTVTEIALRCGFGHLGEFATVYRHTFGEAPRQTLARARVG